MAKWAEARDIDTATALADHLENTCSSSLTRWVAHRRRHAGGETQEDAWRPVALKIAEWLPKARHLFEPANASPN